jgi:hypothetical protein
MRREAAPGSGAGGRSLYVIERAALSGDWPLLSLLSTAELDRGGRGRRDGSVFSKPALEPPAAARAIMPRPANALGKKLGNRASFTICEALESG